MNWLAKWSAVLLGLVLTGTVFAQSTLYTPMVPVRLMDSRPGHTTVDGQSAGMGPIASTTTYNLTVLGRAGIPTTGVTAVALNVTVTDPTNFGFVTVWPAGVAQPLAANLNLAPGVSISNQVIAKIGTNGQVSIYVLSVNGSANVIVDVAGYFPATSDLTPLTPARLLDTRSGGTTVDGQFSGGGAVPAGGTLDLTVLGRGGVPAIGVSAVVLNVTAVTASSNSFITVWPSGVSRPLAANLNVVSGQTIANLVMVGPGSNGKISIYNNLGNTDFVVDVAGYFSSTSTFTSLVPARLLDTRSGGPTIDGQFSGQGAIASNGTLNLSVLGRGGVPATGVGAVALNIVAVLPPAGGYLVAWGTGTTSGNAPPPTMDINFWASGTVPSLVIAQVGSNGQVSINNNSAGATQVVADVMGWFPSTTVPFPPSSVTATPGTGNNTAIVNWTDASGGSTPTYLKIQRATSLSGPWTSVNSNYTPATSGQLIDMVFANATYYYGVAECNAAGCSAFTVSNPGATISSIPATPTSDTPSIASTPSTDTVSDQVGATAAQFRVDEAGNATYSIPIQVPPGTAGVTPKLALSYNSRLPNGVMGPGWTIEGASQISRCRQTRESGDFAATSTPDGNAPAVNFTQTDRFCLDGVRLLLLSGNTGAYGANGTTYSPETDPTTRVTATTTNAAIGPNSFTVQRKDGTTSTYGNTTASTNALVTASLNSQQVNVSWNLARVQDSKGNYIDYLYNSRPSGNTLSFATGAVETTLAQVNYTGHATSPVSSPYASITFAYQTLPTNLIRLGYQSGVAFVQTQQLTSITVTDASNTTNSTLRYYALTYQLSQSQTSVQQLQQIKECRDSSTTNPVCFLPTTFTWSTAQNTFQLGTQYQTPAGPNFFNLAGYKIADVDGDGRQDFVWALDDNACGSGKSSIYVGFLDRTASGEMTLTTASQAPVCATIDLRNHDQAWALFDYDGDGRADLLIGGAIGSNWQVFSSQGRPTSGARVFGTTDLLAGLSTPITVASYTDPNGVAATAAAGVLADLNGDGLPDFIYPTGGNQYGARLLTRQTGVTAFSAPYTVNLPIADTNCDIINFPNSDTIDCAVAVFNTNTAMHRSAIATDVNGDGRADLTALVHVTTYRTCPTCIGTRSVTGFRNYWSQFVTSQIVPPNGSTPGTVTLTETWWDVNFNSVSTMPADSTKVYVVDLNGDGLPDILYQDSTTATTYWVLINNGNGYNAPISVTNVTNGQFLQLVDINADGKTDLVYPNAAYSAFNYVSLVPSSSGWTFTASAQVPGNGLIGHSDWVHLIGDFDGDGAPDYFGLSTTATSNNLYASRTGTRYQPRDVVTAFTNGLGATTQVVYQPLTNIGVYQRGGTNGYPALTGSLDFGWSSPVFDVLAPMYVVSQASSSAPTQANANAMSTVYYRYAGALMQSGGRGFLGFYDIWAFDANDSAAVGNQYVAILNRYGQRFPVTGMPIATLKQVFSGAMTRGSSVLDTCAANPEASGTNCFSGITGSGSTLGFQIAWPNIQNIWVGYSYQTPICAGPGCLTTVASAACTLGGNNSTQLASRPTDYTAGIFTGSATPGPVFSYVSYTQDWSFDLATGSAANHVANSEVENWFCYDGNGSTAGHGNLVGSRTRTSDGGNPATTKAEKILANTYVDSETTWQLGRLTQSTVTFARPGQTTQSRSTSYTYDSTSGLLTSERIQSGGSADQDLRTLYDLDSWGNRTAAYQCSANLNDSQCRTRSGANQQQSGTTVLRYAKTSYDSIGRYTTGSSLPFYSTLTSWNEQAAVTIGKRDEFGNAVQQKSINDGSGFTLNGIQTTQWSLYGVLGRPFFTADNTGKASTTTFRSCSGANAVSCSSDTRLKFRSQTVTVGAPTSWTYYDVLGRPVLQVTRSFDGNIATNQFTGICTYTDAHNRTVYQSEPFFLSVTADGTGAPALTSSTPPPCNSAAYATTTTYDVLGRLIQVKQPDNNTINRTYTKLTTTTSSPRNAAWIWTQVTNEMGEVVSTQDPQVTGDASVGLTVTQAYDSLGDVTSVTRNAGSGNIVTSTIYDVLGRKISQSDPDSGTTTFSYNAAGDVISQTDQKNQTITLSYDAQGRRWKRVTSNAADGNNLTDTWTYDATSNGYGQLASESRSTSNGTATPFSRSFAYDSRGRLTTRTTTIASKGYPETTVYDAYGRIKAQQDITGHYVSPTYSANGYTSNLTDSRIGTFYQLQTTTQRGQVASDMRGNSTSLQSTLTYFADTGRLSTVCSGAASCTLQDLQYHFDAAGNLDARSRAVHGATTSESFTYDAINRLKSAGLVKISGVTQTTIPTLGLVYDQLGNICTKSPLSGGTVVYQYAGLAGCANHGSLGSPHAAIYVGGVAYGYDADGNQTTNGNGRAISYNALNQVTTSVENGVTVSFEYGPDGDRFKRTDSDSTVLTYYIGKSEIRSYSGSFNVRRYLGGVAIDYVRATTTNETRYTFSDHLGSMDVFANPSGQLLESESFDAHGNRRDPTTWQGSAPPVTSTAFGYTNQEHVDSQSFIHMNGRIYDPTLGRMLQADPIRNPGSQGLNRYSYVANNPLTLTDPSGYSWFGDLLRSVVSIAVGVVSAYLAVQTGGWYGLLIAAGGGFTAGVIATGTLQGGLLGAFSAAAFYGIGNYLSNQPWATSTQYVWKTPQVSLTTIGQTARAIGSGIVGGIVASLGGGNFGNGFVTAGFSAALTPALSGIHNEALQYVGAGLVGGTASVLSGGKFANGAITGAFAYAFSSAAQNAASRPSGQFIYPKGGSSNPNDYDNLIIGGAHEDLRQFTKDVNADASGGTFGYYLPSEGGAVDIVRTLGQKFFGWAGNDSLAQGLSAGLAGVDHPLNIISYSEGTTTAVNAQMFYGGLPSGSTFYFNSPVVSSWAANGAVSANGGYLGSYYLPPGDVANLIAPGSNFGSGFRDFLCGMCTHSSTRFQTSH